jgi:hypothetical protein
MVFLKKSKNHPTLGKNVLFGWEGWEGESSPKEKF